MAPETRSGGVPAPSRVYHSSPALQQLQFPARRRVVRTYGKNSKGRAKERVASVTLRQQTLTQLDWVSSFEEDGDGPIVLSDSEPELDDENEKEDGDKENRRPSTVPVKVRKQVKIQRDDGQHNDDEDEEPIPSGRKQRATSLKRTRKQDKDSKKRRRTLGDASDAKEKKGSRRKTMGDPPSSNYHTQTLTQFMAHHSFVKDSDDELENDDDFADWLGQPGSPSPLPKKALAGRAEQDQPSPSPLKTRSKSNPPPSQASLTESVVPQTPAKRIRFEIPSSSQQTTPLSNMLDRYGPLDDQPSPLKGHSANAAALPGVLPGKVTPTPAPRTRTKLVVEDSFATESWGSADRTPTKGSPLKSLLEQVPEAAVSSAEVETKESSSSPEVMSTPTKQPAPSGESAELGERILDSGKKERKLKTPSPKKPPVKGASNGVFEIPDSDEEEEDLDYEDEEEHDIFVAGAETQLVLGELASSEDHSVQLSGGTTPKPTSTTPEAKATPAGNSRRPTLSSEESILMLPPPKPIRKPLIHAAPQPTQTQFCESQRVPLAILQTFPPALIRTTDILLPVPPPTLTSILNGTQVHIPLPYKLPGRVVRVWLFDGALLRYMASVEAGVRQPGGDWWYALPQVWELNNPLEAEDMIQEGWSKRDVGRYVFVPPAVVSQMLWNLRHALFANGPDEDDISEDTQGSQPLPSESPTLPPPGSRAKSKAPSASLSVSQQLEAQIRSDIAHSTQFPTSEHEEFVPSTPEQEVQREIPALTPMAPPSRTPGPPPSSHHHAFIRPSQATTASQASTADDATAAPSTPRGTQQFSHQQSSSSLAFQDYGSASSLPLPPGVALAFTPSQLLTRSQMLPDSLLREIDEAPPEIWDSDEEDGI